MINFTKLTSNKKCNKHFTSNNNEIVIKRGAKIRAGNAETIAVKTLKDLQEYIKHLTSKECLTIGTLNEPSAKIVLSADEDTAKGLYGRNKKNFKYPSGDRLQLLDIDEVREGLELRTAAQVKDHLCSMSAFFETAQMLILPSSSCGVRYQGELVKGYSWHVYIVVTGEVTEAQCKKFLLSESYHNGDGRVKFSESGKATAVSLFDESVFSPERVIYAAKSTFDEGYTVDELDMLFVDGLPMDFDDVFEIDEFDHITEKLISESWVNKESERLKALYIEKKVQQGVDNGLSDEAARKAAVKQSDNVLMMDSILELSDHTTVKVSEMCANHSLYDNKAMPDPIEGWSYGTTTAMFYWNNGVPKIHSFAHGVETVYHIEDDAGDIISFFDRVEDDEIVNDDNDITFGVIEPTEVVKEPLTLNDIAARVSSVKAIEKLLERAAAANISDFKMQPIINTAIKSLAASGIKYTPTDIKKQYTIAKNAEAKKDKSGSFLDDYVYVLANELYHHRETGAQMRVRGWCMKFDRLTPSGVDGESMSAETYAKDKIKTVHNTMYVPAFGEFFTHEGVEYYNTYKKKEHDKVIAKSGAVERMIKHTEMILPNEKDREVLYSFIAHQAQNAGKLLYWALVLQGVEGIGKTYYAAMMREMFGGRNVGFVSTSAFNSDYNGFAIGKMVNCIDELRIDDGKDRYKGANRIKPLITDEVLSVAEKYIAQHEALNTCNYFATTNFKDAVPITGSDRRWAVLFADSSVLNVARDDPDYYPTLFDGMRANSGELLEFFQSYKIPKWISDSKRAPLTSAKDQMIDASKPIAVQIVEWAIDEFPNVVLDDGNSINMTLLLELVDTDVSFANDFPSTPHLSKIMMEMGFTYKSRPRVQSRKVTVYSKFKR